MSKITKVLIVDDSRIFRKLVEDSLKSKKDIEVIGSVRNGFKALEFIKLNRPDIVTLDVEMPDMDGLETLKAIQKINRANPDRPPIGVIMLSAFTRKGADITIEALSDGAFDFITKPESECFEHSLEMLTQQLVIKIRSFKTRRITGEIRPTGKEKKSSPQKGALPLDNPNKINAILIGVSTGGPQALSHLLPPLCEKVALPIFIVQHMPPTFTASLAKGLNAKCIHTVLEAGHAQKVMDRHVYLAPGGRHLTLRKRGTDVLTMLNDQPPELGCRPSVDVLFRSALPIYGGNVVAIILTGMGTDGTRGITALKRAGAYVIAQDEESSVVWGMPGSAFGSGNVDLISTLSEIPEAVGNLITKETIRGK